MKSKSGMDMTAFHKNKPSESRESQQCKDDRHSADTPIPSKMTVIYCSSEARAGFEPAHKGFADLSLTTWVPRLGACQLSMSTSSASWCPDLTLCSCVRDRRLESRDETQLMVPVLSLLIHRLLL
jgi:hypothetical protein